MSRSTKVLPLNPPDDVRERFASKVVPRGDCRNWSGARNHDGYGRFTIGGDEFLAHRLAYAWAHDRDVPTGLEIHHTCDNRKCVNPNHLEAISHAANVDATAKSHCKHGHAWTSDSTGYDNRDRRYCKICRREASRRYRERKRGSATSQRETSSPQGQLLLDVELSASFETVWRNSYREAYPSRYQKPWGRREHAMASDIEHELGSSNSGPVGPMLREIIWDWNSMTEYAQTQYGALQPPETPTLFYLANRNHLDAAINWYREKNDQMAEDMRRLVLHGRAKRNAELLEKRLLCKVPAAFEDFYDQVGTPGTIPHATWTIRRQHEQERVFGRSEEQLRYDVAVEFTHDSFDSQVRLELIRKELEEVYAGTPEHGFFGFAGADRPDGRIDTQLRKLVREY